MVLERSRTGVSPEVPVQPDAAAAAPDAESSLLADPAGSVIVAIAQFYRLILAG